MKKQTQHYNSNSCVNNFVSLLFVFACLTQPVSAQITEERTHVYNGYDVKNYAIDKIPNRQFCVLAGTIFDPAGSEDNSINLMITNNSLSTTGNTIVDRIFDDIGYDERSVGVHYVNGNSNDILVVASRRDLSPNGETNIELLRIDAGGSLQSGFIVRDSRRISDMHPMGTVVVGTNLFICGYTTPLGTTVPDYRTSKEIFIVKYDLNTNNVTASITLDYSYPSQQYDFDMAVRMKALRNGLIFVTGSCSGYYRSVPPSNWDWMSDGYYSATLSLFLDSNLGIISDSPFSEFQPVYGGWPGADRPAGGEYGNDIVEDMNTGGYFVFGNTYVAQQPSPIPSLNFFTITHINAQMQVPSTLQNRYKGPDFDYAWGIGVEEGNSQGWYVLSGVQTSRDGLASPPYPTSMDNINPFLAEIRPVYSGGVISLGMNYWNTILSNEGTGNSTLSNSYYNLGGFNSHIAWSPRNTTRGFIWTNEIFLSAPVWNPNGFNTLNLKTIRTTQFGQVECPDILATPGGTVLDANESIRATTIASGFTAAIPFFSETEADFNPDVVLNCMPSGVFRPTGIQNLKSEVNSITVAPNPANTSISIMLTGDYTQAGIFKVTLTDMTGRQVADLYQGNYEGLKNISLPVIAPGLYLVNVSNAAGSFKSELLSIR